MRNSAVGKCLALAAALLSFGAAASRAQVPRFVAWETPTGESRFVANTACEQGAALGAMQAPAGRSLQSFAEAKQRFVGGRQPNTTLFVATRFSFGDSDEQLYLSVDSISGEHIIGRLPSTPSLIRNLHAGDVRRIDESAVVDWAIVDSSGRVEGNQVGEFLEHYSPASTCGHSAVVRSEPHYCRNVVLRDMFTGLITTSGIGFFLGRIVFRGRFFTVFMIAEAMLGLTVGAKYGLSDCAGGGP